MPVVARCAARRAHEYASPAACPSVRYRPAARFHPPVPAVRSRISCTPRRVADSVIQTAHHRQVTCLQGRGSESTLGRTTIAPRLGHGCAGRRADYEEVRPYVMRRRPRARGNGMSMGAGGCCGRISPVVDLVSFVSWVRRRYRALRSSTAHPVACKPSLALADAIPVTRTLRFVPLALFRSANALTGSVQAI
jgi:hypothetical protein